MNFPEIRIQHGWLLQNAFMSYVKMIPELKDQVETEPTKERVVELISERISWWQPREKEILEIMQRITGLEFYKNAVDVYMVHGYRKGFSTPLVLSFRYKEEVFVDVLTHELIHVILTDNKAHINPFLWLKNKFPEITDIKVLNHILVHAIHKELYLATNRPERLAWDIEKCQQFPSYKEAWDIVEKQGSKELIELFKKEYNLI